MNESHFQSPSGMNASYIHVGSIDLYFVLHDFCITLFSYEFTIARKLIYFAGI